MKILVTGGAGYIGSTLVPLLLQGGHSVRVVDSLQHGGEPLLGVWAHSGFEFISGDITDRTVIRSAVAGMNAVVHLAAVVGDPACSREPERARAVNLQASLALIEDSRLAGVARFLFASTCSNYGKMKDSEQYVDEDSELSPVSLYAETKVAVEKVLLNSHGSPNWCPTPLRFATIFGVSSRMRFDLTVNEFTMELVTKKRLAVYGEQFWRPYVHVRDAARAIEVVLGSQTDAISGRVYNVGASDQNFQKRQIVELIQARVPDADIEYVRKAEDPRDYRVSFARIRDQLGFRPTRTVEQGIDEVVRLIRSGVIRDFSEKKYFN